MKTLVIATIAAIGLSIATPVLAAAPDSGSVGQFTQWQRAPAPQHEQPQQAHVVAHR